MADLLLLGLVIGAGVLGWRRGLAVSLLGGLAFCIIGMPAAALASATGGVPPVLAFLVGGMLGLIPFVFRMHVIDEHVQRHLGDGPLQLVDRVAGALLNVGIALVLGWFIAAIATIVPSESPTMSSIRASASFGSLVETVPPQGTLGAIVLRSGLVPGLNGPLVLAEAPDPASATTPAVLAARASVLQVRHSGCDDSLTTGTGWVAGPGLVVTNAHVVAGSQRVFLAGGPSFDGVQATVTAFDPLNDIAVLVLDAAGSGLPQPLRIDTRIRHGERAAVIGFPLGGEQTAISARIDRVAEFEVEPLQGGSPQSARVLAFRAGVQPGNSGGPIVGEDGAALGIVVAKAIGQRIEAAYGVASSELLVAITEGARRRPADTGPCLEEPGEPTEVEHAPGSGQLPGGVRGVTAASFMNAIAPSELNRFGQLR